MPPTTVRVVVAGDRGTGKSSLIAAAAGEAFPANAPPVLPPTSLPMPEDLFTDRVPINVIDTSASIENRAKLLDELRSADAVVLTCASDDPSTIDRLSTFWLPELRRLEVRAPVIVACCMIDLIDQQQIKRLLQLQEVFYFAQYVALHPSAPLYDKEARTLKPRCARALKRIFILCDHDKDGALSDAEFSDLWVECYNVPLRPSTTEFFKYIVQKKLSEGVNENGFTLAGFLYLQYSNIGTPDRTWKVLRKFGYNNDLRLSDDQLLPPITRTPDQSVELTSKAVEFLKGVFSLFDIDGDGALNEHELEDLFSTAPENPWSEAPYANTLEKNALGGISLDGFLSQVHQLGYLKIDLSLLGFCKKPMVDL